MRSFTYLKCLKSTGLSAEKHSFCYNLERIQHFHNTYEYGLLLVVMNYPSSKEYKARNRIKELAAGHHGILG